MRRVTVLIPMLAAITVALIATPRAQEPKPPATAAATPATEEATGPAWEFALAATGLPEQGFWKSTPGFADLNGDGYIDLFVHERLGQGASAWLGDGKGGWTSVSDGLKFGKGSCGGGIKAADVNNDKHLDLVVGDHCSGVWVFLGDGQGHWEAVTKELVPQRAHDEEDGSGVNPFKGTEDLGVGDFDGDGKLDIVAASADRGGFTVYFGDGSGKVWKEATKGLPTNLEQEDEDGQLGGWATKVVTADFNKDGIVDVLASYYRGPRVYLSDGKGGFRKASDGLPVPLMGGLSRGLAVADINEDGRLDFAVGNAINGAELYLQNADASWKLAPDPMPKLLGGADAIGLLDIDGDGHVDLLVGGRMNPNIQNAYGIFVLRGDGKGEFTQMRSNLPATGLRVTWGVAAGDVNGDGRTDFAVALGGEAIPLPKGATTFPLMQVWLNTAKNGTVQNTATPPAEPKQAPVGGREN